MLKGGPVVSGLPVQRLMIDQPDGSHSAWRSAATRTIALAVVASSALESYLWLGTLQAAVALAGLVMVLLINDGHLPVLGLRLVPVQGWRYWIGMTIWFGLGIAVLLAIFVAVWWMLEWTIPLRRTEPRYMWRTMLLMCVYAPFVEEVVFRGLLTVAVLPTFGRWGTILISGTVFALLHIAGGNPGPDNQVAGFLLAWAFLRSETILVPIVMHAAGNLIALGIQIAAWYLRAG